MTGDLTFFKTNAVSYYGIFCDEFDKVNPYSDILTGVRKKYFESDLTKQKNKMSVRIDGETYKYQYMLHEDLPLRWKVTKNDRIVERTMVSEDESYYVEIKDENDKPKKRIFFGSYHNWQKTQYFVPGNPEPAVQLAMWDFENISVILKYLERGRKPEILYPCTVVSNKDLLRSITDVLGVPSISSLCSMGFVYFAPKEISKKWNYYCENPKNIPIKRSSQSVNKTPDQQKKTPEPAAAKKSEKRVTVTPVKAAPKLKEQSTEKKRIDLTQTKDVIVPNVKKTENVVIPPVMNNSNIGITASDVKSASITAEKSSSTVNDEFTVRPRPFITDPAEFSLDNDVDDKGTEQKKEHKSDKIIESEKPPVQPKLHSDVLSSVENKEDKQKDKDKTENAEKTEKSESISALDFVEFGSNSESTYEEELKAAEQSSVHVSDNDDKETSGSLYENARITQEIKIPTEQERIENIAQRAEKNNIDEVKRAYSMKKVQPATNTMRRTVPIDKIIKISENEQYYYFGDLKDNKRSGKGRTVMENGSTAYDGGYLDDKRDGFGVYYYKTGKICYVGDWKENRRNGVGVAFMPTDRSMYVGGWENDCPIGMGAKFDKYGNLTFAGRWESGTREGVGMTYNPKDGTVFVSHWENDAFSERGTKFDADGNMIYNGTYKKGKRSGQGTQYNEFGLVVYTGEWFNDRYNGKGTLYLSNGCRVDGEFVDGKINGHATVTNKRGRKLYEGNWKNNRYNGEGKLYESDGSWCQGEFSRGESVGELAKYSKDGVLLCKGEWHKGKFNGHGVCYNNGEKVYEGDLSDGIRSGIGEEYRNGRCIYSGSFEENERSGFGTSYDDFGNIEYSGIWSKGVYDGVGLLYDNGKPRFVGHFVMGALNGRVNEIYNDKVIKECIYSEGDCVYMREYTDDALTLKYDGNIKNGRYEGMGCGFSAYGEKYFEGIFKNNEPFKSMKVSLRKLAKLEYRDEVSQSQYNEYIVGPNYVVEQPYNGGVYSGLLVNGMPEGKGTVLYDDHGYTGVFSEGVACGLGVIYEWDGSEIAGTFVKEANENTTEITLSNGITYHIKENK